MSSLLIHNNLLAIVCELYSGIRKIEEDISIYEEKNFERRTDAIDFLDFHIIERTEALIQHAELSNNLKELKQRAEKIKCELEKIDTILFEQIREKIKTGIYFKSSFKKMVREYLPDYFSDNDGSAKVGYDNLDVFTNGLLSDVDMPEASLARKPEMVFYQKTPARIIFEMMDLVEFKSNDVFFDIGSGLGQAAILVNLISGVTAKGIEYEPAYFDYAKTCASQLDLSNVEFINIEADKANYSEGTIFFMYTPFAGSMLRRMLQMLQHESKKRKIRIFTYGPCSFETARHNWLSCVHGIADDPFQLCEFRSSYLQ
ncbi:MAG: hypothetical protein JST75_21985 [Bacteroidetes bacterium]|nr:hypothetical protein [Bacteroidota bacterium]